MSKTNLNWKKQDEKYMQLALAEARKAREKGEVPVGAVITDGRKVLARGHNCPIKNNDPTAHAEIVALRKAARKLKNYRLPGLTMYVTVEPCPMCLGAIIQARIKRLIYGTADPKAGAVVSSLKFDLKKANHHLEIVAGVCQEECQKIISDFFREKRKVQVEKNHILK
ncbi:MAG: nucleoside deaminase [Candidatus Aminicenantes bacterium]|nr:nucleoside deaminase [Candidatus Aminicenantes bacterium]